MVPETATVLLSFPVRRVTNQAMAATARSRMAIRATFFFMDDPPERCGARGRVSIYCGTVVGIVKDGGGERQPLPWNGLC